jgi:hypothetical protein
MWNWDENSLAGKLVGILFRNEEWEYENKTGWAVRPFRAISIDSVREEDYRLPKDKPLKKEEPSYPAVGGYGSSYSVPDYSVPASNFAVLNDDDAQLPF